MHEDYIARDRQVMHEYRTKDRQLMHEDYKPTPTIDARRLESKTND